ncbi:MAG: hypothetical protein IJ637_04970 [Prevotella sp.]|nr:hypothetical protein [Prevotella sp.]
MKKTVFYFAAAMMMAGSFGIQSCSVVDNTPAAEVPAPEPVIVSLQEVPFCVWDGWLADAQPTATAGCAWEIGNPTGLPYGDGNVINYSDLSAYSKLVVVATEGTPRFLLNRDVNEGQWNADESQSHLIEYPKDGWSSKYFTAEPNDDGATVYTVDLAQIVLDKGFAHLHSIKGANWANVTVTSMELVQ